MNNEIELPDGFEDISKRVRLSMAKRVEGYIDVNGDYQSLDWSAEGKRKQKITF